MDHEKINLLYIEDDVVDRMAFKRLVKEHNLSYQVTFAGSVKEAKQIFSGNNFDIIISDFLLGDGTSFEFLPEIVSTGVPVIMVTGTGDEDVAVKAIKIGASDYLIKDVDYGHLKMLPLVIESSLQKKQSEYKLKKLSIAAEQSPSMLIITDNQGNLEYINPKFTEITGYSLKELQTENLFEHHATLNETSLVDDIINTLGSGKSWQGTTRYQKKNGEEFWESTKISPIYDDDNHQIGYIKVSEDITEKKLSEEAIKSYSEKLRESNASKDKMFSIIAHDLRAPFNGLMTFSDILSNEYDNLSKEDIQEYIGLIKDLSKNTSDLLEKLLQWSRLQTGRMEFHPSNIILFDLVNSVFSLLMANAREKNIALINRVDENLQVFADQNMLNAIVRNISSNAIKFTPENGEVTISAALSGSKVTVVITDNGIGIPAENLNKLFRVDSNFTSSGTKGEAGSGLGLILCHEFVERHNGTIHAESEPGKGSRFIFTLPAQVQSA